MIFCCILAASVAQAQTAWTVQDIPSIDRLQPHFYNAIGNPSNRAIVSWSYHPDTITTDSEVILRLQVGPVRNPAELQAPPLATEPSWQALFATISTAETERTGDTVTFRYRMRPRRAGEFELPLPKYRIYYPEFPAGQRFQLAIVDELKIQVAAAESMPTDVAIEPIVAPAWLWRPITADQIQESMMPQQHPRMGLWLVWIGPGVVLLWYGLRWWLLPSQHRLAWLRRRRAARVVLQQIESREFPHRAAQIAARALLEYLQQTQQVPTQNLTAQEFAQLDEYARMPVDLAQRTQAFLLACEQARFGHRGLPIDWIRGQLLDLLCDWENQGS